MPFTSEGYCKVRLLTAWSEDVERIASPVIVLDVGTKPLASGRGDIKLTQQKRSRKHVHNGSEEVFLEGSTMLHGLAHAGRNQNHSSAVSPRIHDFIFFSLSDAVTSRHNVHFHSIWKRRVSEKKKKGFEE